MTVRTHAVLLLILSACTGPHDETASARSAITGPDVPTCGWASAVRINSPRGWCSGALVHPEILVTAAHCGTGFTEALFGEASGSARTVAIDSCSTHPMYGGRLNDNWDFAYCRLATPVNDVPIVPIAVGCDLDVLAPARPVVVVGWGDSAAGRTGIKRYFDGVIMSVVSPTPRYTVNSVLAGEGACPGDSGGPTFLELDDGSYRLLGSHSTAAPRCDGGVGDRVIAFAVPWIELDSGLDITPCHTADGDWSPGPDCGDVPTDPGTGSGTWPACGPGPETAAVSGCAEADAGRPIDAGSPDAAPADSGAASDSGASAVDAGADSGLADGGRDPGDADLDSEISSADGSTADGSAVPPDTGGCQVGGARSGASWFVLLFAWVGRRNERRPTRKRK